MTALSSKKILQEKNTNDPNSITTLTLTHKALSDVSCLSEFKNLEKLDLGFNNLTSLEDLKSCVNLKWLSVVQNKLQSLKGIEGLSKLTVLNAGKNKLKSMNEVDSLVSLRALILNDNEISSVCKLDQMKELNTLVLSRNPITSIGESLAKLKSITKLSLSNCQLQTVDSSLKSCLELKELRLAHNEIMTVPGEFAQLVKLQNLDMGNNLITRWSNLKVLSSLVNLKNLNLQGNPLAEKENLVRKVKKLLPNLHIFNAKPIDKIIRGKVDEKMEDFSVEANNKSKLQNETKTDDKMRNKVSVKAHPLSRGMDNQHHNNAGDMGSRKERKEPLDDRATDAVGTKKKSKSRNDELDAEAKDQNPPDGAKNLSKRKKQETNETAEEPYAKLDNIVKEKGRDKKSMKKIKRDNLSVIDSAETPFMDLFATGAADEAPQEIGDKKLDPSTVQDIDAISGLVTFPTKKKKRNRAIDPAAIQLSQVDEIGLGGPSAWG